MMRTAPSVGSRTVTTVHMRRMLGVLPSAGQGSGWCCTAATGSRVATTLPKRMRRPAASKVSTAAPKKTSKARHQRGQLGRLVARRAGHALEALGDLLQAQHVEVGHGSGACDDALWTHDAVETAAPLRVPGDKVQDKSVCSQLSGPMESWLSRRIRVDKFRSPCKGL